MLVGGYARQVDQACFQASTGCSQNQALNRAWLLSPLGILPTSAVEGWTDFGWQVPATPRSSSSFAGPMAGKPPDADIVSSFSEGDEDLPETGQEVQQASLAGASPQQYSSYMHTGHTNLITPTSAFQSFSEQQSDGRLVIIEFCRPQQDAQVLQTPASMPISESWPNLRNLSRSPSEGLQGYQLSHGGSSSFEHGLHASSSAPVAPLPSLDSDLTALLRPTVQTGMYQRSESAPPNSGGKRVHRTAKERRARRMAKNRVTAAASRQRKRNAKMEVRQQREMLEEGPSALQGLLSPGEQEIDDILNLEQATTSEEAGGSQMPDELPMGDPFPDMEQPDPLLFDFM